MGKAVVAVYTQVSFRARTNVPDPAALNTAFDAGDASLNSDWTQDVDTIIRVRFVVSQTILTANNNIATEFALQYNKNTEGWTPVAAIGQTLDAVRYINASFADGDNCTQLLSGPAPFIPGDGMEITPTDTISFTATPLAAEYTEIEVSIEVYSGQVVDGDAIQLRLIYSLDDETPPATILNGGYTEYPDITVSEGTGAETVPLGAVTLVSSAQLLSVDVAGGPLTVPLSEATLASSPQSLDVIPGAKSVEMQDATLASSPQAMESVTSVPPAQMVYMVEATLASSSQALNIVPGNIDVFMSDLTLVSASQVLDVSPGAVSALMSTATLVSSAQALESVSSVPPAQTVNLGEVTLASTAQALDVIPGVTTVSLGAATLISNFQALTIITITPQTVDMSAATLAGTAQALDIIAGAITVPLGDVTLASSAQALNVAIGAVNQTVNMQYATLASAGQSAGVLPGTVLIQLLAISLNAESQTLSLATGIAPVTVEMAYAALTSSALSFNLAVDRVLSMGQVVLVATPQGLVALAGPGSQTIYLDSISAGLSLLSAGVLPGEVRLVLNTISLVSDIQDLTIILGAPPNRILSMIAQSLASSVLPVGIIGGTLRLEVILRMSARCHTVYESSSVSTVVTKISSIALEEYEL